MAEQVRGRAPVSLRWLGAAGLELSAGNQTLVIDPYVTRIPFRQLWLGRLRCNEALVAQTLPHADYVIVTHAHFDHLMDVPALLRTTGALAHGSANTCALLRTCGVPQSQIRMAELGAHLDLGAFGVRILPAEHLRIPGFGPGALPKSLYPPLRARDYRYDSVYSLLVTVDGHSLFIDPSGLAQPDVLADVVCIGPLREAAYYAGLVALLRPHVFIPIHCDDLFRPLSKPVRPTFRPPGGAALPLRRLNLDSLRRAIEQMAPGVRVLIPERLRTYALDDLLGPTDDAHSQGQC